MTRQGGHNLAGFCVLEMLLVLMIMGALSLYMWPHMLTSFKRLSDQAPLFRAYQLLQLAQLTAQTRRDDIRCELTQNGMFFDRRTPSSRLFPLNTTSLHINYRGYLGFKASGNTKYAGKLYHVSYPDRYISVGIGYGDVRYP